MDVVGCGAPRAPVAAALLLLLAFGVCAPAAAGAQEDSVTKVAGERYRAGRTHRFLFGDNYRDLWTRPVQAPVLDPNAFAGGLTVLKEGGGFSTMSLRMRGGDGREYVFRSVDKDVTRGFGPEFRGTLVEWIVQDQVSAKLPAAPLPVPPLLEAAGVLHAPPRLFVLPDHRFLGEFRPRYAGLLGTVEERPNEGEEDEPSFAGAVTIAGTERLLEHLEKNAEHRVESRAFLTARLMDLFIGDWDRHEDQWRWARFDHGDTHLWHPIPRDRDNAFVSHEGAVMSVVRSFFPRNIRFREQYPDVFGLTVHATQLDRLLLADLPKPVWDSTALALRARLTDEVIDAALSRLPREYREVRGPELRRILTARRNGLPGVASEFFSQLARDVDVHATDERDVAIVDRLGDGAVEVRIFRGEKKGDPPSGDPYFRRTFQPAETREVRVYLRGGKDLAIVRGDVQQSIGVRVIGGGGDDVMVDSSRVRSGSGVTAFYDHRGENRFEAGRNTTVDRRRYEQPADSSTLTGVRSNRDWGIESSDFTPWAGWKSNVGLVVGGGPVLTRYGFRREPYARRRTVRGMYALATERFGVEFSDDFLQVGSDANVHVFARASDLEVTRFHGYGNETRRSGDDSRYKVGERQLLLAPTAHLRVNSVVRLSAGPTVRYTDPRLPTGNPAAASHLRGARPFGYVGAGGGIGIDTRDQPAYPRRGFDVRAAGAVYPVAWSDARPFGSTELTASTYLTVPVFTAPTLAVRAGGRRSWGEFPLQEAAFVGGSGSLRGYPVQRYAGHGAAFGNAELRVPLIPINLVMRGELGVLGLVDAGRVWAEGESSSRWHTAAGGGVWLGFSGRSQVVGASYAYGEEGRVYLWAGFPF